MILDLFRISDFELSNLSFVLLSQSFLGFASYQSLGMTFEIIRQNAQRACRAGELLQGIAQVLLGGSVLADKRRVRALEQAVGRGNRAAQFPDDHLQLRCHIRIDAIYRLTRVLERLIERDE